MRVVRRCTTECINGGPTFTDPKRKLIFSQLRITKYIDRFLGGGVGGGKCAVICPIKYFGDPDMAV